MSLCWDHVTFEEYITKYQQWLGVPNFVTLREQYKYMLGGVTYQLSYALRHNDARGCRGELSLMTFWNSEKLLNFVIRFSYIYLIESPMEKDDFSIKKVVKNLQN